MLSFRPKNELAKMEQTQPLSIIWYSEKLLEKPRNLKGKRCQVCQYIKETGEFEDDDGKKYDICKGVINCTTDFTVYKFHLSLVLKTRKKRYN